jgi:hypothetical protein
MTKEEKRLKRNANAKKYNANKTKEQKEAQKIYRAKWNKANKDKIAAQNKRYSDKVKEREPYYTVYYLKEDNYVGQTAGLSKRLAVHKYEAGRHVLDVEVLGKFETREEAKFFEAKLHDMGYAGKNKGH